MKTFWRLFKFAKPIEKFVIPYFFFVLLHALFNAFNFVLIIPILNTLFDGNGVLRQVTVLPDFQLSVSYLEKLLNYYLYRIYGLGSYDVMQVLIFLSIVVVTSVLLSNLFRYLSQRTMENLRIHTLQNLRNSVFSNLMQLHVGFFSNERKGDIISKITSDVQVVQFCITNTLQVLFREPFLMISYFVVLVRISGQLTLFSILVLPLSALVIGFIIKKLRSKAMLSQQTFGEMVSAVDESITGVKIIKSYNIVDYVRGKFCAINDRYARLARSMARRQQLASPMSEFLGVSVVAVILIYGGSLVLNKELGASDFMAYIAIFSQVTRPARALADSFSTINQGLAASERVFELLDTPNEVPNARDAITLPSFKESIEFRNVSFAYENRSVLNNISFTIKKGETVALVGPSGGGKSTISDLIPRFYDVKEGAILIDGIDVRRCTQESLRDLMGMVAQETILFNDTIEQNIRLGRLNATQVEIENAAKIANANDFIQETDHGFHTNIGDHGMKLSGGQRQRLSIARAVLKNPDILILDEATSALDTESEKLVQDALNSLLKGRTSLVIAHRLSTIHNADKIIVVDKGEIVEQGTHCELMARKGVYSKLIEMQQLT